MKKLLPLILFCIFSLPLHAHVLKLSDSELTFEAEQALWKMKVHFDDFAVKFGKAEAKDIEAYIPQRLSVSAGGMPCEFQSIQLGKKPEVEAHTLDLTYRCPQAGPPYRIHYDLFYGDPNHRHLIQVKQASKSQSHTFDPGQTELEITEGGESQIGAFFKLGLEHILIGYDHILFVLALVFRARTFKNLVWLITTFTLAHSITLALATLEWVSLPPEVVEPAIAASIVLLALLDLKKAPSGFRFTLVLTFAFGLIHGLGFSYILKEANLKAGDLATPLVFFNLGVEFGQLAIVALVYPLTRALSRVLGDKYRYFRMLAVLAILGVGLYWLWERLGWI